ncbi:MAG: hypothetical protein II670_14535 [Alphaproteobacteria bacterium]|nr:hypothetical protein [Alphaproteobacteria bacterium]
MEKDILTNVKNILDGKPVPERKVKVMKKDKGLYERTKESTILLTEDNKLMLTD